MTQSTRARGLGRLAATVLTIGVAAGALGACNTIGGAGKDVSAAGTAVTGGANDVKAQIPSP